MDTTHKSGKIWKRLIFWLAIVAYAIYAGLGHA
jgi:hypothetical protein